MQDLQALYTFNEWSGSTIYDVSGESPALDLTIADLSAVTWGSGTLSIDSSTTLESALSATRLSTAVKGSNEVTVEAWITPSNLTQTGPSRIAGLSNSSNRRNVTLGQVGDDVNVRLRTTTTGLNGLAPALESTGGQLIAGQRHVVYTRAADGTATLYVDSAMVETGTIGGNLSTWADAYTVILANEIGGGRAWLGEFDLVAIYSRALSAAEVDQNFQAGPGDTNPVTDVAPLAVADPNESVDDGQSVVINVLGNDTDVNNNIDASSVAITLNGQFGTATANPADGTVTYVHTPGAGGTVDTFEYEVSDTTTPTPLTSNTAVVTVAINSVGGGTRVTAGQEVLYTFDQNPSALTTVADVSGESPALDLTIADLSAVTWGSGTLSIDSSTTLESALSATRLSTAVKGSNEVTVEAWITPSNLTQTGPSRIAGLSNSSNRRNVTLGQVGDDVNVRLRTTTTGLNGSALALESTGGQLSAGQRHVVYTRAADGTATLYVDSAMVETGTIGGNLSTWADAYTVILANEIGGGRAWLGEFDLVAIYSRALSAAEVVQNYSAGNAVENFNTPNQLPVAVDDNFVVNEDAVLSGNLFAANGGDADSDADGEIVSIVTVNMTDFVVDQPINLNSGALLTLQEGGDFIYYPFGKFDFLDVDDAGQDGFSYTIQDDRGGVSTANANIQIIGQLGSNAEPTAADDQFAVTVHSVFNANVLDDNGNGEDADLDGNPIRVTALNDDPSLLGSPLTLASGAVVLLNENGDLTYDSNNLVFELGGGEQFFDNFTYTIADNRSGIASASVLIIVTGLEDTPRVVQDLQALYTFNEGSGSTIYDVSGIEPAVDLQIENIGNISWAPGILNFDAPTIAQSVDSAIKLNNSIRASNSITVEAWIKPTNTTQTGPAEIVSLSDSRYSRNVGVGQGISGRNGRFFNIRLRSQYTGNQGNSPSLSTPIGSASTELTHLVFTRESDGVTKAYVNGEQVESGVAGGSLANWGSDFRLALGREIRPANRNWLGSYDLVAFYSRALSATEVLQNYSAGNEDFTLDFEPPTTPSNLIANYVTDTEVTLNWGASADNVSVYGYRVDRNGVLIATVSDLNYFDTGLTPTTTYSYSVTAIDFASPVNASTPATLTVTTEATPDTEPPTVPTNLRAPTKTDTQITLAWDASTDSESGVSGYRVLLGMEIIATVTETTYTHEALTAETDYTYSVIALDNAEPVNASSAASLTVTTESTPDTEPPTVPTNLRAPAKTDTQITLAWDASTDSGSGVSGYRVLLGTEIIATVMETTYTHEALTAETDYTYSVIALDNAEPVNASSAASLTVTTESTPDTEPPTVPTNLRAPTKTDTQITLAWDASTDSESGVSGYRVLLGTEIIATVTETTYTHEALTAETDYAYSVIALDNAEPVNASSAASLTVTTESTPDTEPPTVPTNLRAPAKTDTQITLAWDASTDSGSGVSGYRVLLGTEIIATVTETTYTHEALTAETDYTYSVIALDNAEPVNASTPATLTVSTEATPDTEPPTVPTNLRAPTKTDTQITLAWDASMDSGSGVSGYRVLLGTEIIATVTETTYTHEALTAETDYTYSVIALDNAEPVNESGPATVTITTEETLVFEPPLHNIECLVVDTPLSNRYSFDDISSNEVLDRVGNQNIAIENASFVPGIDNQAISIDADANASLGFYDPPTSNGLTITSWVFPTEQSHPEARIVSKASGSDLENHYIMASIFDGDALRFRIKVNGTTASLDSASGTLDIGQWNFVTFSFDLSFMRIHHNGILVAIKSLPGEIDIDSNIVMSIGNQPQGLEARALNGLMDDLRFYDGALSNSEILSLNDARTRDCVSPINLTSLVDGGTVNLSWESPVISYAPVETYEITRDSEIIASGVTFENFTDSGLNAFTDYTYNVRLINENGYISPFSAPLVVTSGFVEDNLPPDTPTNLRFSNLGQTSVMLEWDSVADNGLAGLEGYELTLNGQIMELTEDTSFLAANLFPGTVQLFSIVARDNVGNVSGELTGSVTTESDLIAPTSPTFLTVLESSRNSITLQWNPSEDVGGSLPVKYDVYRDDSFVGQTTDTFFIDATVAASQSYSYTVYAADSAEIPNQSAGVSTAAISVDISPTYDSDLPMGGIFYGNYESGLFTGNASIAIESSRRFLAEKSGQISAVRYNNRVVTDNDVATRCQLENDPSSEWCICQEQNLDRYTCGYVSGNSYTVGTGGSIIIEVRPDDGTDDHEPAATVLGRTSGVFVPQENSENQYPILELENPVDIVAGQIYHLVYKNINPPVGCAIRGVDPAVAATCPVDQGAMGLNGTKRAFAAGTKGGTLDPFRGNIGAILFKRTSEGPWVTTRRVVSWYELRYSDNVWVGDSYAGFGSTGEGRHFIEGGTHGRQVFTVADTNRIVDGIWVNFGHSYDTVPDGSALTVQLKDSVGSLLAQTEIPASPECIARSFAGNNGGDSEDLHCRAWDFAPLDTSVTLLQGSTYSVEFSAAESAGFSLSSYIPLNYPPFESESRNHWSNAQAEISMDGGSTWGNWSPSFQERDLPILFTVAGQPRFLTPSAIPSAPTGLTALVTSNTVTLEWNAVDDDNSGFGLQGYRVSRDNGSQVLVTATSYVDTGLEPDTEYRYRVTTLDNEGNASAPVELLVRTEALMDVSAPPVPTGLAAQNITTGSITLVWNAVEDEVGGSGLQAYLLSRDNDEPVSVLTGTSYIDTSLDADTDYVYKLSAIDNEDNESTMVELSVRTQMTGGDGEAPTIPANLQSPSKTDSQITLEWDASTDIGSGVAGYRISRNNVVLVTLTETTYTDIGLDADTPYMYSVVAIDSADPANESFAASLSVNTDPVPDTELPSTPANFIASGVTYSQVNLSWDASTDNSSVTGYLVSRNGEPAVSVAGLSYIDSGLAERQSYTYTIVATDSAGNQSFSTSLSILTPSKPAESVDCPAFGQQLVNRYTFDVADINEPTNGGVLVDSVGTRNGMTSGTSMHPGVLREAISVGGASELSLGNYDPQVDQGVTISAWVYPNDLASVEGRFLSKANGISGQFHYLMASAISGSGLRFRVRTNSSTATLRSSTGWLQAGVWSFVTFTYDLQAMRIFHNGQLIAEAAKSGPVDLGQLVPMAVGNQPSGMGSRPFNGLMDDLRIYNGALTQSEIQNLMAADQSTCPTSITAPQNIIATVDGVNVNIDWIAPQSNGSGFASYQLSRDGQVIVSDLLTTSYLDTGLEPLREYIYTVSALDIDGAISPASEQVVVTTGSISDVDAPQVPADAAASTIVSDEILLSWSSVLDIGESGVSGYRVIRGDDDLGIQVDTQFLDTDLIPLTTYSYVISALDNANNESDGVTVSATTLADTTVPSTPENFKLAAVNTDSVTISWDVSEDLGGAGLDGYILNKNNSDIGPILENTTYTDTDIVAGQLINYQVRAIDNAIPTANESASVSLTVSVPFEDDVTAPPTPSGLSAETILFNSVTLSWDDVIDIGPAGLAGYEVYRGSVFIGMTSELEFTDTAVTFDDIYLYGVRAIDAAIPANKSTLALVEVTIPEEPDSLAPEVPTNLRVTELSSSVVELTWDNAIDIGPAGLSGYVVNRDNVDAGFVAKDQQTLPTFTDTNIVVGRSYTYSVKSVDNAQNSSDFNSISVDIPADAEPPDAPARLAVFNVKPTSISLWWVPSSDNGGGSTARYDIFRDNALVGSSSNTSFIDDGLESNRTYSYLVRAVDDAISENSSDPTTVIATTLQVRDATPPPTPANIVVSAANEESILIDWDVVTDTQSESPLAGYKIRRDGIELPVLNKESYYIDIGLDVNSVYEYQIAAIDTAGNISSYSALVTAQPAVNTEELPEPSRFAPAYRIVEPAGTTAQWGDIDGDGDDDLAVADGGIFHTGPQLLAWFEAPDWGRHEIGEPIGPFTGDSRLVDIDGDGDLDYVVSADSHSDSTDDGVVYWYENTQRQFEYWEQHIVEANIPDAFHIGELRTGDIDNDGKIDIAVRHLFSPTIVLYFQNTPDDWSVVRLSTRLREGLQLRDLDNDDRLDIIANGYYLFAPDNPRSGTWQEVIYDDAYFTNSGGAILGPLSHSTKAATVDFNSDGRTDVVVSTAEGSEVYMAWYEAPLDARNGVWERHIIEEPLTNNHQVEIADIDLDDDFDIFGGFSFNDSSVFWWENINGDALSWERHTIDFSQGCYNCVASDFDDDGDVDYAGPTEFRGAVYFYENLTSNTPEAPTIVAPVSQQSEFSQPVYQWQPDGSPYYRVKVVNESNSQEIYNERIEASSTCTETLCSFDIGIALNQGDHLWYVRAESVHSAGDWAITAFEVPSTAAIEALWGPGAANGNNTGLNNYVLHLIGQSNANNQHTQGPNIYLNNIDMLLPNGTALPDALAETKMGVESVLAESWPGARQVVLIRSAVGGASIRDWLVHEWPEYLQKIDNLPIPPDTKHVVLWVQGGSDTNDVSEAGQAYVDSTIELYNRLTTRLTNVRIVDALLNPVQTRSPGMAVVVNQSKALAATGRDNVVLIGGDYDIGSDNSHFTQTGFESMAEDFLEAISGF